MFSAVVASPETKSVLGAPLESKPAPEYLGVNAFAALPFLAAKAAAPTKAIIGAAFFKPFFYFFPSFFNIIFIRCC